MSSMFPERDGYWNGTPAGATSKDTILAWTEPNAAAELPAPLTHDAAATWNFYMGIGNVGLADIVGGAREVVLTGDPDMDREAYIEQHPWTD